MLAVFVQFFPQSEQTIRLHGVNETARTDL